MIDIGELLLLLDQLMPLLGFYGTVSSMVPNRPPIILCAFFQNLGDMVIFSVEYRKAPRFTFPSQIEETVAVTRYILAQSAQFGIDPKRVAIMGDSAGGALSATVAIKMRPDDPNVPHPLAMQVRQSVGADSSDASC